MDEHPKGSDWSEAWRGFQGWSDVFHDPYPWDNPIIGLIGIPIILGIAGYIYCLLAGSCAACLRLFQEALLICN